MSGEIMQQTYEVAHVADLLFAQGTVGDINPLPTAETKSEFAKDMTQEVRQITKPNTAYCGDEREIERMHDGSSTQEAAYRLFGGIGLSATKALVAADASIIKDATSFSDAYSKVIDAFDGRYEDAGHEDCGARKKVKASVEAAYDDVAIAKAMSLLGVTDPALIDQLNQAKKEKLQSGFYDDWSEDWHEDYLKTHYPQNYAYLKGAHEGSGLVVITKENLTLTSNGRAFAVTLELMNDLARQLSSGSAEEQARIYAAFVDDTLRVGGLIVKPGFPAFAA